MGEGTGGSKMAVWEQKQPQPWWMNEFRGFKGLLLSNQSQIRCDVEARLSENDITEGEMWTYNFRKTCQERTRYHSSDILATSNPASGQQEMAGTLLVLLEFGTTNFPRMRVTWLCLHTRLYMERWKQWEFMNDNNSSKCFYIQCCPGVFQSMGNCASWDHSNHN